jgi:hypothetical protein
VIYEKNDATAGITAICFIKYSCFSESGVLVHGSIRSIYFEIHFEQILKHQKIEIKN